MDMDAALPGSTGEPTLLPADLRVPRNYKIPAVFHLTSNNERPNASDRAFRALPSHW